MQPSSQSSAIAINDERSPLIDRAAPERIAAQYAQRLAQKIKSGCSIEAAVKTASTATIAGFSVVLYAVLASGTKWFVVGSCLGANFIINGNGANVTITRVLEIINGDETIGKKVVKLAGIAGFGVFAALGAGFIALGSTKDENLGLTVTTVLTNIVANIVLGGLAGDGLYAMFLPVGRLIQGATSSEEQREKIRLINYLERRLKRALADTSLSHYKQRADNGFQLPVDMIGLSPVSVLNQLIKVEARHPGSVATALRSGAGFGVNLVGATACFYVLFTSSVGYLCSGDIALQSVVGSYPASLALDFFFQSINIALNLVAGFELASHAIGLLSSLIFLHQLPHHLTRGGAPVMALKFMMVVLGALISSQSGASSAISFTKFCGGNSTSTVPSDAFMYPVTDLLGADPASFIKEGATIFNGYYVLKTLWALVDVLTQSFNSPAHKLYLGAQQALDTLIKSINAMSPEQTHRMMMEASDTQEGNILKQAGVVVEEEIELIRNYRLQQAV